MTIKTHILTAIRAHAAEVAPVEACGLVIVAKGKQKYIRCRNISRNGTDTFILHPEDYAAAEDQGEIIRVVHSHPFASPEPSQLDRISCGRGSVPWLIVNHPVGHYIEITPDNYAPPLVGREFVHGVLDCYSLVRDYYAQECQIILPDFERNDEWWRHGGNLYLDNFAAAGFDIVSGPPETHDAFLMQIRADVPNHAAVYLGDGMMMHHMYHRLSTRDVYGGYWQKATVLHLRHRSFSNVPA